MGFCLQHVQLVKCLNVFGAPGTQSKSTSQSHLTWLFDAQNFRADRNYIILYIYECMYVKRLNPRNSQHPTTPHPQSGLFPLSTQSGLLAYPHPPDLPIFEDDIKRCLDFSVFVRCMPVNPVRDQGTWCTSGPFTVNRAILLPARLQGWVIWGGLFVEGSVRIHYTTEGQWASISSM